MTQAELYALFSAHEPGPVPNGEEKGTAIVAPDTPFNAESAEAINLFAWQARCSTRRA
jgi:hypothetical protein